MTSTRFVQQMKHFWHKNQMFQFNVLLFLLLVVIAFVGAFFARDLARTGSLFTQLEPPLTNGHILGTDVNGHDVIANLLVGARNSLVITGVVSAMSLLVGGVIGTMAGYFGGTVNHLTMTIVDLFRSLPLLMIVIVLVVLLPVYNIWILILLMTGMSWVSSVRIVRNQVAIIRTMPFVQIAKMGRQSNWRIIRWHILPNVVGVLIVQFSTLLIANLGIETGLSFLGFRLPNGTPSLGVMVSAAMDPATVTTAPWIWLPAMLFMVLVSITVFSIGQGVNRAIMR